MDSWKLSIIIPVYNELLTIWEIIQRIRAVALPKEIIIVDDCSTDGTRQLYPEIKPLVDKIVLFDKNQGKGAAIREGLRHVTGEYLIIQDADLEYDPQEYHKLLKPLLEDKADVVYGSRFFGGQPHRVLYFWHSVANRLLTLFSNMLTNLNLTDMETCYKMFRTKVVRQLEIRENRFGIEPEITGKLARMKVRFYEVGISYHGRSYEEGKKIKLKDAFRALWCVLKYSRGRYHDIGHETLRRLEQFDEYGNWILERLDSQLGDRVLEIGSGLGSIAPRLINRRLLVLSDINEDFLDVLRKRYERLPNVKVVNHNAEVFNAHLAEMKLDTILCLNVLEHIENDVQTLRNFHKTLQDGGKLFLLVPSGKTLYGAIDRNLGHVRRYSREELTAKLAEAGFQLENLRFFNRVGWAGWFVAGKLLKSQRIQYYHINVHRWLMPVCKLIDKMTPLPFGLSLIGIARKR